MEDHPLVIDRQLRILRAYAQRFPEEIESQREAARRPLEELRTLYLFLQLAE
ncbi:MAG: hypothetical protein M3Q67_06515 [Actinomycetota bacterium]|nr:hypothetical protein [Actinomycetota bacterium]